MRPGSSILTVYAVAAMSIIFWGATPVVTKIAVADIDPIMTGLLRAILAGPVAIICALALRLPIPADGRSRLLLAISGVASFAIWPVLLTVGVGMTTATHAGLIIALIPVVTGVFASIVDRVRPRAVWFLGSSVAIVGTAILILSRNDSSGAPASILGDLLVFVGVIACAIGYIAGAKITPVVGTWVTTFWGIALAAIMLVPVAALVVGRTIWATVGVSSWLAMFYLAFFGTIGGYVGWYWALGRGGITRISSWQLAQPAITVSLAALILGEPITLQLVIIATMIIAATAYAQSPARG